tara:strand:+ start:4468 stop:6987 length:2520 start_codon:yes stop_codon:yes gene_type:complete
MALPALLGAGARAIGGQMVRSGGRAAASKILNRKEKKQRRVVKKENGQQATEGGGALVVRPKSTMIPASIITAPATPETSTGTGSNILLEIYNKVIEIDGVLKGTLAEEKARSRAELMDLEEQKRQKQEGKLEKKKTKDKKEGGGGFQLPQLSFFDRIKQFISSIITGFILQKLVDFAPQLEMIGNIIGTGIEIVTDLIIGVVDAAGTFLKWGQDAYDATKGFLKDNFGEGAAKTFEGFMSNLNTAFNLISIIALGVAAFNPFEDLGKDKKKVKLDKRGRDVKKRKQIRKEFDKIRKENPKISKSDALKKATEVVDSPPKPKGFFGRIGQGFKDLATKGVKALGGGLNYLSGGNLGKLGNFLQDQYKNASEFARKQYDRVTAVAKRLKGKFDAGMKSFQSKLGSLAESAKQLVVQKILDPLKPFLDPIIEKAKSIGDSLYKALQKIPGFDNITKVLKKFGGAGSSQMLKKLGAKALPVIGGIFNLLFAYDRLASGDSTGALIETVSAGLDFGGLAPGSMALDAYMFARDFVPAIQETETNVINGMGLGGLKSALDTAGSKLPDLGSLVKMITGGEDKKETKETKVTDPAATGGGQPTTTESGSKMGEINVEKSNNIVNIGKDLISKGFSVAEHPDFTKTPTASGGSYTPGEGSVSDVHSGRGHYEGRAIDVTDWRGTLEDSKARYRSVLDSVYNDGDMGNKLLIHDSWGIADQTGKDGPGAHGHPTHMHIEVKDKGGKIGKGLFANLGGPEFVLDSDSFMAIENKLPGFLGALNKADGEEALKVLASYASYEQGGSQTVIVNRNQIIGDMAQQKQKQQAPIVIPVASGSDATAGLYAMS